MGPIGIPVSIPYNQEGATPRLVTEDEGLPTLLVNSSGESADVFRGAVSVHTISVHDIPINQLYHRNTGLSTTLSAPVLAGARVLPVDNVIGLLVGDEIRIKNGSIEATFPIIVGINVNDIEIDRPIDRDFLLGDSVEQVTSNIKVDGSITPVSFKLTPDGDEVWHIVRFLIGMVHDSAADDSKFGDRSALEKGCVFRAYDGSTGLFRTYTVWKTNFDIKMDMFDLVYTDKAGAGNFGTNGRGSIDIATGATPKISGANGDYLELLVQDDLTGLIRFNLKGQGHIEDQ